MGAALKDMSRDEKERARRGTRANMGGFQQWEILNFDKVQEWLDLLPTPVAQLFLKVFGSLGYTDRYGQRVHWKDAEALVNQAIVEGWQAGKIKSQLGLKDKAFRKRVKSQRELTDEPRPLSRPRSETNPRAGKRAKPAYREAAVALPHEEFTLVADDGSGELKFG
jgi:hypothetical protein